MNRALFITLLLSAGARGQCVTWTQGPCPPGVSGITRAAYGLGRWDPDGPGPAPTKLVVGGAFTYAGALTSPAVALWDGTTWSALGLNISQNSGPVRAITEFDPDGDGPQPRLLVVGGYLQGVGIGPVMAWNGSAWINMSGNLGQVQVDRLAVHDPDGAGPLPARLFAAGNLPNHNNVCYYEDGFWSSPGPGVNGAVAALLPWDPDGAGPQPTKLYVGGSFTQAGGLPIPNKAAWTGSAWEAVGTGLTGVVNDFAVADTDGAGPQPERLFACGALNPAIVSSAAAVLQNGAWQIMGTLRGPASRLVTLDPDGAGPAPGVVYAGAGAFGSFDTLGDSLARWTGSAWAVTELNVGQNDMTAFDADGPGGRAPELVVSGQFQEVGPYASRTTAWGVAHHDGTSWRPMNTGIDQPVYALGQWDHDRNPATHPLIFAGGYFVTVNGAETGCIAYWNGQTWNALPNGRRYGPTSFTGKFMPFDPDGAGPQPEEMIIADSFETLFTVQARLIARWDGTRIAALGDGLPYNFSTTYRVLALEAYDRDGPGPLNNVLIAAGAFGGTGYPQGTNISQWNGSAWSPLGDGLNGQVRTLAVWSPGGAGPFLYAGGSFSSSGATSMPYLARWDGSTWLALPNHGLSGCNSLLVWDADGAGLGASVLLAATATKVRQFTGEEWSDLGGLFSNSQGTTSVGRVFTIDPDLSGPQPAMLMAAGAFDRCAGVTLPNGQAVWNGSSWQPFSNPLGFGLGITVTYDPDGDGPILSRTLTADSKPYPSISLATLDYGGPGPAVTRSPRDATVFIGGAAQLSAAATSGSSMTARWLRDGTPLSDGPSGTGSVISGSGTGTLAVSDLREADSGQYVCEFTNACGASRTGAAMLAVVCYADFDASGGVDGADVEAFFRAWESGDTMADVDQSGGVDGGDVEAFFVAWERGGCG